MKERRKMDPSVRNIRSSKLLALLLYSPGK